MKIQEFKTKLTLKKETIAGLNTNEMRNVKGGKIKIPYSCPCNSISNCAPPCTVVCAD